jgi:hypothetical protein
MSQNWRVGFDPAFGTSPGWALARPRLRRLAEESSGHLDEGEKLVTPVAICTRGGRAALFSGLGVFALTLAMLEVMGYLDNRIGGSSLVNAAFIASGALAAVLMLLGFIVAHKFAVVPTDRRLLVFRWSGMFMGHIRDIFIAAARSDESADLKSRHPYRSRLLASVLGWGDLRSDAAARDFASTRPFVSLWPLGSGHQVTGGEGHD